MLHSSPAAVHSNMPLQQEGGKTEKLDKPLAHPSTWKESGFNAGEKGCKQNKRWFVLMVYSQDKNPFSSITCLAPFLQRREEEEKEAEWRWFKGITRTIKEEGKGNEVRGTLLCFSKLPCVCWLCGGGVRVCMFALEGQREQMQMNSLSSRVNAISFNCHLIISVD